MGENAALAIRECCGAPTEWDPLLEGYSCGGLALRGWHVCRACGTAYLSRRSRPVEAWKLAAGGRSVDTGTARIRAERSDSDTAALMARIARLPDLETALQRIAIGAGDPVAVAKEALGEEAARG